MPRMGAVLPAAPDRQHGAAAYVDPEEAWRLYLAGLERFLQTRVQGQALALTRVAQTLQASELGLNAPSARPRASFLFLGPTGVGKTETAKAFTQYLFGAGTPLQTVFMNEYADLDRAPEFLARLEGAVVAQPEGGTLLFDEVEKAHVRFIDLLLSLLDEGLFTGQTGRRHAVTAFYVVMTSNLGSGDLANMENAPQATMERVALEAARDALRPELFARITDRVVFRPLSLEVQRVILETLLAEKLATLGEHFGRPLTVETGPVAAFLLRAAYSRAQGARHLRQEVERQMNLAALPWALRGEPPPQGRFRHDAARGVLVLD